MKTIGFDQPLYFWDELVNHRAGKITRDDAVARIALRYENFVGIFEKARPS